MLKELTPIMNRIFFIREDYSTPGHIIKSVKLLSDHFKVDREYLSDYLSVLRFSKRWKIATMVADLQVWESNFTKIYSTGTYNIVKLTKEAFLGCTSKEEIDSLRGAIVEAIIIGCFEGHENLKFENFGWGASVNIREDDTETQLKYLCSERVKNECDNRLTVDFGYWDGKHGQFFECKVEPKAIGCKEVNYMKYLKEELRKRGFSHEIFFVSPKPESAILLQLDNYDLGPTFKPFGINSMREILKQKQKLKKCV